MAACGLKGICVAEECRKRDGEEEVLAKERRQLDHPDGLENARMSGAVIVSVDKAAVTRCLPK